MYLVLSSTKLISGSEFDPSAGSGHYIMELVVGLAATNSKTGHQQQQQHHRVVSETADQQHFTTHNNMAGLAFRLTSVLVIINLATCELSCEVVRRDMKDYTGHQAISVTGHLKQNNIDFLTASKDK